MSTDQTALNTQVNRYYVQSQYYYRAGNIPERRGLPFEARTSENGVEARLIKAIQQVPVQAHPTDDVCSQCMHDSRQSTLSNGRGRYGYERIYWKDRDTLQKRVPSNDSLHRNQLDRHRSTTGSSSDMSHYYEYISDNVYDSYTGRRSNHSTIYLPSCGSYREPTFYGDARISDDERGVILPKVINRDYDVKDSVPKDAGHYPSNRDIEFRCDKEILNKCITESPRHTTSDTVSRVLSNTLHTQNKTNELHRIRDVKPINFNPSTAERNASIKGYKYTYNPSFDEDTATTTSRNDVEESSSPETPSECFEIDDSGKSREVNMICAIASPRGNRHKQTTPTLRSNRNSETTSLSDISPKSNSIKGQRASERYNKCN